jgi:hypothetical protein
MFPQVPTQPRDHQLQARVQQLPNRIHEWKIGFDVVISGKFSLCTDAMAAQDKYRAEYPPLGYGTQFAEILLVKGQFLVSGKRFATCD